jgi:hypothetical protein
MGVPQGPEPRLLPTASSAAQQSLGIAATRASTTCASTRDALVCWRNRACLRRVGRTATLTRGERLGIPLPHATLEAGVVTSHVSKIRCCGKASHRPRDATNGLRSSLIPGISPCER